MSDKFFFDETSDCNENIFEGIKRINEYDQEFWYARELQKVLEYTEWRNFLKVIVKAMAACENSGIPVDECFVEVNKSHQHRPEGQVFTGFQNSLAYWP